MLTLLIMRLMITSTLEAVPGHQVTQILGLARGSTVRSRNVGRDLMAGVRNLVGGEVTGYTKLQAESREQALQRMVADASKMGADAVIGIRMSTSMITDGAAEILIYGTAVKLSPAAQ